MTTDQISARPAVGPTLAAAVFHLDDVPADVTVGGAASGASAQAFFMAARGLLLLLTSHGRHQAVAVQFGRPRARAALLYVANCRFFKE